MVSIDVNTKTSAGTPFPELLQILTNEHRNFRWLLAIVREEQKQLATVDLKTLKDVLRYLSEYPEQSHYPCERRMINRATSIADDALRKSFESILDDHDRLQTEGNRLYFSVMRARNGEDVGLSNLAAQLTMFADAFDEHLRLEEDILYPIALEILDDEEWVSLLAGVNAIDDPLFGTRVRRRYRHLARVLETRFGWSRRGARIAGHLSLGAIVDKFAVISEAAAGLGVIVADHAAQTFRENLDATRDRIGARKIRDISGLPAVLNGNTLRHMASGFKESRELLARTMDDIRTPYNLRIDATGQTGRYDRES